MPGALHRLILTSFEVAPQSELPQMFAALPPEVREQARAAYRLFRNNPRHPGLNFKRVHATERFVSARVGRSYRAVGVLARSDEVIWFWIGPHEQYETLLYTLR